jgi:DNA-nicking Smr family endonuclease
MGKNTPERSGTFAVRPFERLKKEIAKRTAATVSVAPPPPPPPPPKNDPQTDDEIFRSAMSDVQEISEFRRLPCPSPRRVFAPVKSEYDNGALKILSEIASGDRPIDLSDTQEYVEWTNPAFRGDLTRQLHEGRFSVRGFLDLHGCCIEDAEGEVGAFLVEAVKKGLQCVKIIHGRGLRSPRGPVLKDRVTRLLAGRHHRHVIAYVTARQCDGGLGALYVLLKTK